MQLLGRLRYALYVLVTVTMVVGLALSIGEVFGFIRGVDLQRLMFHPLYFVPVLLFGFALAPLLSDCMPLSGHLPSPSKRGKPPVGYPVRAIALVALGLALAVLANLVAFAFGKLA